jgi:hypothetical protein
MAARWDGFRALANQLPNREVLAVELIRTRDDMTVAVFTVVENAAPIKYAVVGDANGVPLPVELQAGTIAGMATSTSEGRSIDPAFVAMGQPPPQEPTPVGILAAASDLLATAFDAEPGTRAHPPSMLAAPVPTRAHDVMAARWEGFRALANQLPDHEVLAVELIRTRDDTTVAVFTVVESGTPIKYAVTGDAHGNVPSAEAQTAVSGKVALEGGGLDPAIVAAGNPPPTEPTTPGVVAAGRDLLPAVFQGD